MHLAAMDQDKGVIEYLSSECKHLLNKKDIDGMTPLLLSLANQASQSACMLLHLGADPNIGSKTGEFPMHMATIKFKLDLL